ncbi:VCBS repeat-containing protein [Christiangramia sp. SM2212]|uniref:VCBS repeat-containing protein n=1 Tax=Christiangramia sediminicola TaxID=3073267 RepID=A0ABU1ENP2_9FLAO|nr:VCBS repeat-containing protein [Christiangramia sp. SM2212]MDR5590011.1 VCBS repeat-containing protein [Christiangramia sp. SM2212]
MDSSKTGIDFSNNLKQDPKFNILTYLYYYNGAGVAAADYNGDGWVDLYFISNRESDKLYINQSDFQFTDITDSSGINNSDGWSTGISNVDINNDGRMDIYICKVSGTNDLTGHNLLFVNLGNDEQGNPRFEERSKEYGLDFSGFSTQSAFLDYDDDGDLDMYLLNHSTHPNKNYGSGAKRKTFDPASGDRLFKNDNGKYVDVSKESRIFQGITGYGLGVSIGDLNNDSFPDIYVGNDFFENDYIYINQKDGTFKELNSQSSQNLGHTSHYSMGNEIADINNDGFLDIVSLDMLPEDLETYKTSGLEYPFQTYSNYLRNGFAPQYMQNTLHINRGDLNFSETAFLSGIAATEWSWSPLFADLDNDGFKDLFITNGIKGATNNMDYIKYISTDEIQKQLSKGGKVDLATLTRQLPEKKVQNYIFKNTGDKTFDDFSDSWLPAETSFSHGSVYADLDNDGDLDLVTNNTDEPAFILRNNSNSENTNYLDIELQGPENNILGIGSRVEVYSKNDKQTQEHYLSRGYLSSVASGLHFGLGDNVLIDSVKVIWYDGKESKQLDVKSNQKIKISYNKSKSVKADSIKDFNRFEKLDSIFSYTHTEQSSLDFNRQLLSPFAYSNLSPKVTVADMDNDGLDDVIFGGGKTQALQIQYQQKDGSFKTQKVDLFEEQAISEDTDQFIFDANGDGLMDMLVVSGGNEFKSGQALRPRLYLNSDAGFSLDKNNFQDIELNASSVTGSDIDLDGDLDILITSTIKSGEFGMSSNHHFFRNDDGIFVDISEEYIPELIGIIQNVAWEDFDADGYEDLIVAGHWSAPQIFLNKAGKSLELLNSNLSTEKGWWNDVVIDDFDNDGDLDLMAANWGLNSRLSASSESPANIYINDFDDNGTSEPILTYNYKGRETLFASKDELDQQLPFLKKKFTTYEEFARADFEEIFPEDKIQNSVKKQVSELASCYFENTGNGNFIKHLLPFEVQASQVFSLQKLDFNNDGFQDVLLVGNNYEISTQLGRLDASHGVLLVNDGNGNFEVSKALPDIPGASRDIEKLCIDGVEHMIITRNGDSPIVLKINNESHE